MVTIPFKKIWIKNEQGGHSGRLHKRVPDCLATINTPDGEEVGSVCGVIGGGMECQVKGEKELHLFASPRAIWNAYCEAIGDTRHLLHPAPVPLPDPEK